MATRAVSGHPFNVKLDNCYLNSNGSCILLAMEFVHGVTLPLKPAKRTWNKTHKQCRDLYDVACETDWYQDSDLGDQRCKRTVAEIVTALWFLHTRVPPIVHRCCAGRTTSYLMRGR